MTLRLFDTETRAVRDFEPLVPGHASVYLCGATVQGEPHIGHVRSGVAFDVLRRWLAAKGLDVAFVRNVTDIDDKILRKAGEAGRPWWEWKTTYERAFTRAYDALGVLPPSVEPRATGHITQMVELMQRLIDAGHAYASDGNVYFDVMSFPEYGALSGHKLDDVHQGESAGQGKRDSRDFTLWKAEKPGEPSWPTPWGRGRPGWHLECSAMAEFYLGGTFDIHCGGMDLVFPHHENEIAQARAAGDGFARYWLHNGWVTMGGEKMSKSLGNVLSIPNVLTRVRAQELRYYLAAPTTGRCSSTPTRRWPRQPRPIAGSSRSCSRRVIGPVTFPSERGPVPSLRRSTMISVYPRHSPRSTAGAARATKRSTTET